MTSFVVRACEKICCARDLAFRRCSESSCIPTYTPVPVLRRNSTSLRSRQFFHKLSVALLLQQLLFGGVAWQRNEAKEYIIVMTRGFGSDPLQQDLADFFEAENVGLLNYLRRQVGSPQIAAELAQETYLRFLRLSNPREISDLKAFLFTIATNLARDCARQRARFNARELLPLDSTLPDPGPEIEDRLASEQALLRLERAIDALPTKTREVFLRYRVDGLSQREIAAELGISERTVEYHVRQALVHCRRYVKR